MFPSLLSSHWGRMESRRAFEERRNEEIRCSAVRRLFLWSYVCFWCRWISWSQLDQLITAGSTAAAETLDEFVSAHMWLCWYWWRRSYQSRADPVFSAVCHLFSLCWCCELCLFLPAGRLLIIYSVFIDILNVESLFNNPENDRGVFSTGNRLSGEMFHWKLKWCNVSNPTLVSLNEWNYHEFGRSGFLLTDRLSSSLWL